ncbi:MAG: DsrE family protein [Armatimonadota bacterium]
MKTVLFMIRTAPHGSAAIPESHRACLGFATMPFEVNYLLTEEAVWALQPGQRAEAIGGHDARALVGELGDLDVSLYAEAEALEARGIDSDAVAPIQPLSADEIADLIAGADAVLTY